MTQFYLNNPLLKKAGTKVQYTEGQIEELKKCYNDVNYFVMNYVQIISLDKGKILFKLYDYQKTMIETFAKNRHVICMLSRQNGKCVQNDTYIKVRNKKTGVVYNITIGEFYKQRKLS